MKQKNVAELKAYFQREIDKGKFVEIAVPELRSKNQWVLIGDQHTWERTRERDLKEIIPQSAFVVPVLNPLNGVIAAVAITPPQQSLLDVALAAIDEVLPNEVARLASSSLKSMQETDLRVVEALNSAAVTSYEDLLQIIGTEHGVANSLKRIRRFKSKGIHVQTIDGVIKLEPEKLLTKSLRSAHNQTMFITYQGIEGAPRGELQLGLRVAKSSDGLAGSVVGQESRLRVRLDTLDNRRTLKLLQASQLMELEMQAVIGKQLDLATGKWVFTLESVVDEEGLQSQMGAVGTYILENF